MELYHLINRGIDGRKIFIDDQDRARFVHDLYEFNDVVPAPEFLYSSVSKTSGRLTSRRRKCLVDIHGWKLMENHIHLLVSERVQDGLPLFFQKMSGYPRYFNNRHKRHGQLFENGTKKILIEDEAHFLYILHYLHLNGLDDFPAARKWRERDKGNITDIDGALKHLLSDRWSSYRDYCGVSNFPSILTKTLFQDGKEPYENQIREYLKDRENIDIDLDHFE